MKSTLKEFQIDCDWLTNQRSRKKNHFELNLGRMTKTVFRARPVSDVVSLSRLRARRTECQVESRRSIMTRKGEQHLEKQLPQLGPSVTRPPQLEDFVLVVLEFENPCSRPEIPGTHPRRLFTKPEWRKVERPATSKGTGSRARKIQDGEDVLRGPDPTYRFLTYLTTLIKSIGVIWASFGKIKIEFPFLSKCPSNI